MSLFNPRTINPKNVPESVSSVANSRVAAAMSAWPMWVLGFTAMIDSTDQYIVRGAANQIEATFRVGDLAIGLLFSVFILLNGFVTLPAGYLADRWNRSRAMAFTVAAWSVISALGGGVPAGAFGLLVFIRGSLGFGQAITDPSGSSLLADYYVLERRGKAYSVQQCLTYVGLGLGLIIGSFFATHFGPQGWRLAFGVSIVPGLVIACLCLRLPEPKRGAADRARVSGAGDVDPGATGPVGRSSHFPAGLRPFLAAMFAGLRTDVKTILSI
ncbi:MAG: MFS transporter, partial [Acidimicrobiales bacterium]